MYILILIDVQYLQNDAFLLWKRLEGWNALLLRSHHLIKNSTPSKISHSPSTRGDFLPHPLMLFGKSWSVTYPVFFLAYINYTTSGYMLVYCTCRYIFLLENKFLLILNWGNNLKKKMTVLRNVYFLFWVRSIPEYQYENLHSLQSGTKSHLEKQSHLRSQFPPEMTLLSPSKTFSPA